MIKENLNYSVSDNVVTINTESLKGKKVVDATITLEADTLTLKEDVIVVANFVDSVGQIIWENVDTITIKSANTPFIVNVSDELQHAIDNKLDSAIIKFTTTITTEELKLEKVEDKAYKDVVYMSINEFMKNSAKHSVGLNSAGDLSVNLVTGKPFLERTIMPLKSNALMLNLNHIHTSYFEDIKKSRGLHSNCGTNWKLSTEQYLIKETHPSGTELVYLNKYGQEERFVEEYYYLDDNKAKVYVNKDEIEYDVSGTLKYRKQYNVDGKSVYELKDIYTECKTTTGLKLVTDKKDIKGAEYVDLEPEELSQIRAQAESIHYAINQLKSTINQNEEQLCNLILTKNKLADLSSGETKSPESFTEEQFITALHQTFEDIKKVSPAFTETTNEKLENLFDSLDTENVVKIPIYDIGQQTTYTMQINTYTENIINYYNQLNTYEIEQLKVAYQLKIYEEQTPKYYLYSDSVIYGFSKLEVEDKNENTGESVEETENSTDSQDSGETTSETTTETTEAESKSTIDIYTLTYISDYYGNTYMFKYDTGTNTGYETKDEKELGKGTHNLLYIVDQNENIITFNYKDGLLDSIVDSKENKYEFDYIDGNFSTSSNNGCITARYIYNEDNKLVGALDKNGLGCFLTYSNDKVEKIKPLSALDKIEHQASIFKTELNEITAGNIESCILEEKDFVKIEYYDYKSTKINSVKLVKQVVEGDEYNYIEQTNKTITYLFDQYGNTTTTYLNEFDETTPDNNNILVQNFEYDSDNISFSAKPLLNAQNLLANSCFEGNYTERIYENYTSSNTFMGDDLILSSYVIHEAYHKLTSSESAQPYVYLRPNYIPDNTRCLILSGWAKANSAFVVSEDYITDKQYSAEIINRKFEIGAIVTYTEGDPVVFKKSFDWMNTGWQFMAVPVKIDTTKTIQSVKCYIDYSNNTGEIVFTDLAMYESQYSVNEYNNHLLDISYSSTDKYGKKYIYNEDDQLVKVYYIEKNLLINNQYELKKIDLFDTYEYNIYGKLWRTTDYNSIVTEKVFDNNGIETKSLTYHKDNPAEILYSEQKIDEFGNMVADYNELGDEVNNYTYDTKSGNVVSVKDSSNIETSYGYSCDGSTLLQTATNVNGLNNTTTYGYTLDFLTKLSHNDFDITYDYDNQGRMSRISIADTEYASMEYLDKVTKTKFKQDSKDKTIETTIDDNGNLSSVKYTSLKLNEDNTTEYEETTIISNEYNSHGQIIGSTDGLIGEETEYWYDENNNLKIVEKNNLETHTKIENIVENNTTTTNISIAKHLDEEELVNESLTYTYTYDNSIDNNLTSITLPNGTVQNIHLDKLGRTKAIVNGNFTKQYSYLTKGNHTSNIVSCEKFGLNGVSTDNIRYSYDEKGNITEVRENGVLTNRYTYDSLSRLIREDNKPLNKTTTYEYDAGGNILHKVEYNYTLVDNLDYEQGTVISYTYPTSGWKDRMLSYNGETCEYDELGNPITYRGKVLTWNYGRRLMSYDNISYTYDANGVRRIKEVSQEDGTSTKTYYFTNGTQILGQYDGNLMLFHYGVDGVTGFSYNGVNYTYKKNILGDIIGIYDKDKNEIVRYMYDGFGRNSYKILSNNVEYIDIDEISLYTETSEYALLEDRKFIAEVNPFRYRGYYYDIETKLYYLNSRYYDPETGRFINADDVSILNTSKDEINGLNLYAYCFNNPINDIDANGNWSWKKFWKVVGAVAIVTLVSVATGGIAVGIAGALGATTAISSGLMAGAIIGGFIAGGGELISQLMTYGINGLDYGSLFIQTGIGSVIGAFTSVTSTATSLTTRTLARIGVIITSGLGAVVQGRYDGKSNETIFIKAISSMIVATATQIFLQGIDKVGKYLDNQRVVTLLQYLGKFKFGLKQAITLGLGRVINAFARHVMR